MRHTVTYLSSLFSVTRSRQRALLAAGRDLMRRGVALLLIWLIGPVGVLSVAYAQAPPNQGVPPANGQPPQAYNSLDPDKLHQLVAPIALYPDSLIAQVLGAGTYPTQVVEADRFVKAHPGVSPAQMSQMVDGQNWDPSVKALTAFPSVLANMDRNLDWTTQLGNAYYNQPSDVMSAVQADRQQAYQSGKLRTTPQLAVTYAPSNIVIAPANPAVVYVPYYDPWVMWGWHPYYAWYAPPPPAGVAIGVGLGVGLAFGVGIGIGAFAHFGWGWGHWGMGWGPHPFVAFNHTTYISRSVTVINHGNYGHFDRDPGARAFNARYAHAAGFNHGFAAGPRAGFNAGARAGFHAGARAGFHNGARAGYNRGFRHGSAAARDSHGGEHRR